MGLTYARKTRGSKKELDAALVPTEFGSNFQLKFLDTLNYDIGIGTYQGVS